MKMHRKINLLFPLVCIPLFLAGCMQESVPLSPTPAGVYTVDPLFREFYNFLGGQDTLGEVISPIFVHDEITYQFTDAAMMVYDPSATPHERFSLGSLGLDMNITQPAVPQPDRSTARYVNGHIISPEFVALYDRLGGEQFVGKPLTEMNYNAERKRYEQYFEKVGFYRLEGAPEDSIRLLAYGAWKCDLNCRSAPPLNSVIEITERAPKRARKETVHRRFFLPYQSREDTARKETGITAHAYSLFFPYIFHTPSTHAAFDALAARLAVNFTGLPLTPVFQLEDGSLVQIFEHVVLTALPEDPEQVSLLPLPEVMGIQTAALEPANNNPLHLFHAVSQGLGYNVPGYFLHYLQLNGGLELSGPPITRFAQIGDHLFQQCFTNLCLEEDREAAEGLRIRPSRLGQDYKDLFFPSMPGISKEVHQDQELSLQIWERDEMLPSGESQEIGVGIWVDGLPGIGLQPFLVVMLPDGNQQEYPMPAAGSDGKTRLSLPPISAPNGTLIPYQVCVSRLTGEKICVRESFLIWDNL